LLVADFTYVRLISGVFVSTAFVIDAFAGRIVGWECSTSKHPAFVESTIRQAAALRAREATRWPGAPSTTRTPPASTRVAVSASANSGPCLGGRPAPGARGGEVSRTLDSRRVTPASNTNQDIGVPGLVLPGVPQPLDHLTQRGGGHRGRVLVRG
jgi:hypothetical protein